MAMVALRSGEATSDARLDRCRQVDLRSLDYPIRELLTTDQYANPRSYTWPLSLSLDQGPNGACIGFGFAHELAARPGVISGIDDRYAREVLYWGAQQLDGMPGGSYPGAEPVYEGTSTLAGAKICKAKGYITEYRWALNLTDLVVSLGYRGPAVIGVDWFENMFEPDTAGFIHPNGQWAGGHCVCVIGIKVVKRPDGKLDPYRTYFIVQNSWGPAWGINGRCCITLVEMAQLWPGGEFCIPVVRATGVAVS